MLLLRFHENPEAPVLGDLNSTRTGPGGGRPTCVCMHARPGEGRVLRDFRQCKDQLDKPGFRERGMSRGFHRVECRRDARVGNQFSTVPTDLAIP